MRQPEKTTLPASYLCDCDHAVESHFWSDLQTDVPRPCHVVGCGCVDYRYNEAKTRAANGKPKRD